MRIPPSVIVMSLVTAVPFGLAIRDWSQGKDKLGGRHHDDDDLDADDDYSDAQNARMLAEMAKEEARERARAAERQADEAKLDRQRAQVASQLIGAEPGTMGPLFAGMKLGASSSDFQPESVRAAIAEAVDVLVVSWDLDTTHLNGLTARLKVGDLGCAPLTRALVAWGPGNNNATWENPKLHQRALFDQDACTLTFERYVDLDKWLAHGDQSVVPLDMIGQPAGKLRTRIGERLDDDNEAELRWHDLGPAGATGASTFTAELKNGKIAAITVDLSTADEPTSNAIAARLTKLLGKKPTQDEDTLAQTWKGRVPVTLSSDTLTIGTPSP